MKMVECGVFLGFFENEFFLDKAQLFLVIIVTENKKDK